MIEILHATYGCGQEIINATEIVRALKSPCFLVSNAMFGDPCVGKKKVFFLYYKDETGAHTKVVQENEYLFIPNGDSGSVGIFYSNNNHDAVIHRVVQQLRKAKNIDIITCPWDPIKDNPFPEFLSPVRFSSHLTIVLQILKLLNVAASLGRYNRVFFLEHDVLYPHDYFDTVGTNRVDVNMNYMGICKDGWQPSRLDHEPLHQMNMSLEFALKHFHWCLDECLSKGACLLEPDKKHHMRTLHPAVHINHGRHFTSHFSIYDKNTLMLTDEYWGAHTDWWDNY